MDTILVDDFCSRAAADRGLPGSVSPGVFAEMQGAFSRSCVDVVFVDFANKKLLLAKRRRDPERLWMIGGTVKAREPKIDTARRKLKEETGLEVDPQRLQRVWQRRYMFAEFDSECLVFLLDLTDKELLSIKLNPNEYESNELVRCNRAYLESLVDKNNPDDHIPLLLEFYDAIFPQ